MPVQDFLADTESVDPNDPYAGAAMAGRRQGNADVGILPPSRTSARSSAPARAAKPFDPLDDPQYKQAALARKELHQNEGLYHQRIKDFDATEGAPLKWKTVPGQLPGDDPQALATDPAQAALKDTLNNAPGSDANVQATRRMQLLAEKRQRLVDEANRITHNRIAFDEQTFNPLRDSLLRGTSAAGGGNQADTQPTPSGSDYLAPEGNSPFADQVAEVNARRQRLGQPAIAPGSVSAGNFTESWVPLAQRTQQQDPRETPSEAPEAQNNPPGDETAYGGRDAETQPDVPDVLDEGNAQQRRAAMADDLRSQWAKSNPSDRLKMMFGSKGYGQNDVEEAKPMFGSEAAGVEGAAVTIPKMQGDDAFAGAINAANKFSSGMTSPENAMIAAATGGMGALAATGGAIGKAAQIAKTAALSGFTIDMLRGIPEQLKNAYHTLIDPKATDADKAEAVVTPGLNSLITALAGHGALKEGQGVKGAAEGPPPDFVDQGNRFRPFGPDQPGGMSPGTPNLIRKTLLSTGAHTPEEIAGMSDMEAHQALQAHMNKPQPIGAGLVQNPDGSVTPSPEPPVDDSSITPNAVGSNSEAPASTPTTIRKLTYEEQLAKDAQRRAAAPPGQEPPDIQSEGEPAPAPPAVEPVDSGARNPAISDGSGTPTPHEAKMIADWKAQIEAAKGQAPAAEEPAPAAAPETPSPANPHAIPPEAEGDFTPANESGWRGHKDGLLYHEGEGVWLNPADESFSIDGGETWHPKENWDEVMAKKRGQEPISSASQPTSENAGETSNDQLSTEPKPEQSGLGQPSAESGIANRGPDSEQRVEPPGQREPNVEQPDRGGSGEQPRGDQGDGAQLPGAGERASGNADDGHGGPAGGLLNEQPNAGEPLSLESPTLEQQGQEAQVAREKAAAQRQKDELAAQADKPLTGDSSNVGQGVLDKESEDLFSGPSAESAAAEQQAASEAADRELLGDQPVKLKATRASDGAEMEIETKAKEAEKMLSDRHNALKMLLDCLGR